MGKFISNLFLGALALVLSIFTASRTLDLLAWALPTGQVIYQWLGLAAFEGGMYFWSFYFVSGAKGVPQRSIALCMAVFSVLAVCIATIVDLSLGASEAGKIAPLAPAMQQAMIIFVGVTIALNVASFLACKLMSPEKLREIKSGQAEDLIYAEGLRAIEAIAPQMAADAAPHLAAEWSNRTWQRLVPGVQRTTQYLGPVGTPVPALPASASESLPLRSPTRPAPVVVPSEPAELPKKRGKLLGFLGLGEKSEPTPATLAQTGYAPAHAKWAQDQADAKQAAPQVKDDQASPAQPAPTPAAPAAPVHRPVRRPAPAPVSSVAAARRARRAARHARPRPRPRPQPQNGGADAAAPSFPDASQGA